LLLHRYELLSHARYRADGADAVADLDRAYAPLDQLAVDIYVAGAALGVEAECDRHLVEQCGDGLVVDYARAYGSVFGRIERDGAVHGARIDEYVAQTGGNGLCECALAA
jgi:hypothetical protein